MEQREPSEIRKLLYEGRWQLKHLLSMRTQFGDEFLHDTLIGAFTDSVEPDHHYQHQQVCGRYLLELCPSCHLPVKQAMRSALAKWNLSVEQLPYYFEKVFGREAVLQAIKEIEAEGNLTETEQASVKTFRYWLHAEQQA
jgi:hypothetical protein